MAFISSSLGKLIMSLFDSTSPDSRQIDNTHNVTGGGFSLGNAGGWTNSFAEYLTQNYARRGITQTRSGVQNKHAVGDAAGIYTYVNTDGGVSAASDEGVTAATLQSHENPNFFHGTVSSASRVGGTPTLAFSSGNNWTTDGAFLLNITKGTLAGNLNGASSPLSLTTNSGVVATFLNSLPVTGVSLPVSTAIGIATAPISPAATTRDVPVVVTVTVNLAQIGGVFKLFTNGSVVTVAGNQYPEQSIVSAATGLLAGNQQSFTLHVCNPNAQAVIFQGGIQGQYISFDANIALSGFTSSYFAFGSLTGTDLIYGLQVAGGVTNNILPQAGCEAAQNTGANSGFHLYPGAEVAANNDTGFNCTLEQNGVHWDSGDVVQNPHYPVYGGSALFVVRSQFTPTNSGFGSATASFVMDGPGTGGGNTAMLRMVNNYTTLANYAGSGGPLSAPACFDVQGTYSTLLSFSQAPNTGPVFHIGSNPTGNPLLHVFDLNYASSGNMFFHADTGMWAIDGKFDAQNGFFSNHVPGISTTVALAKLTTAGANGSLTVSGGIITAYTPPT